MNENNNKFNITKDNYINLAVYDKDIFDKIFPNSTEDDYFRNEFVVNYPFKVINEIQDTYNINLNGSRFVYIDNDFLDFCIHRNLSLNQESLYTYLEILSDDECEYLWHKSTRDYDLVLFCIPLIIKSFYKRKNNKLVFSSEILDKSKIHLSNCFNIDSSDIYIFNTPLSKDETVVNKNTFEHYFKGIISNNKSNINFVKSIFKEFTSDSFSIKYLVCAIKIDRSFKMSNNIAELDSKICIDSILLNDEMAMLSDILSANNLNAKVYPAFDRIISFNEIESSEEILRKFLPDLIVK